MTPQHRSTTAPEHPETAAPQDGGAAAPRNRSTPRPPGRQRVGRLAEARAAPELAPAPVAEPAAAAAPAPRPDVEGYRFSAILDEAHAATFDRVKTMARAARRRPVSKAELLRALIDLVADDAALREQLFGLIK
jgi:hypothetical protein